MLFPVVFTLISAVLSVFVAVYLSDRSAAPKSAIYANLGHYTTIIPVLTFFVLSFSFLGSIYSGIALLGGFLLYIGAEHLRRMIDASNNNSALFNLAALAISVLCVALMRLGTSEALVFIAFFLGVLLASHFKPTAEPENSIADWIAVSVIGILGATYFYTGSDSAAFFPLLLLAAGSASMLLSIFVATYYSWKKPAQMLSVASVSFVVFSAAATTKIILFNPQFIAICIAIGVAVAHISYRIKTVWAELTLTIAALLFGYLVGEFYGIIVVFISFAALKPNFLLLPKNILYEKITGNLLLIILTLLTIRSVAMSGRSVLFEIGDPYLLSGALLGILLTKLFSTHASKLQDARLYEQLVLLIPAAMIVAATLLFGKIHGTVLSIGALAGILCVLFTSNEAENTLARLRSHFLIFLLVTILTITSLFALK